MIRRILLGVLCWWGVGNGQSLPAGKGRAEFQRICGTCHGLEMTAKLRQSAEQWSGTVDEMVGRGAQGTDDELELIVKYLAANFGPNKADGDAKGAAGAKINVNAASAAELVGGLNLSKSDAEAIVQRRTEKGNFKDWSDLQKVPGIDLKKLDEQKDRIVFTATRSPAENQK